MLLRKALSAYVTSFALVAYYSYLLSSGNHSPGLFPRFDEWMQWMAFISLYVFPVVFVYGSLVSIVTELATDRLLKSASVRIIASCAGHVGFGALFGLAVGLPFVGPWFALLCAAGALLFFVLDRLMGYCSSKGWRKRFVTAVLALPLLAIAAMGIFSVVGYEPAERAPFTAEDAVRFATSGTGLATDVFPKEAGAIRTELNGYQVTRETSVIQTGTEKYEVTFRELWSNEEEHGSRWFTYTVSRNGSTSKDSGGDTPPY